MLLGDSTNAETSGFTPSEMEIGETFEKILLPVYHSMVCAYKDAGAKYVFLHSDGDIRPLVDMLVEAGIDGLNPLERRAGMDPLAGCVAGHDAAAFGRIFPFCLTGNNLNGFARKPHRLMPPCSNSVLRCPGT